MSVKMEDAVVLLNREYMKSFRISKEDRGFDLQGIVDYLKDYYNNAEATQQVLQKHEDGQLWIHSGDIVYVTEDGFVYIVDRIERMIIRRGYKVFPSEIENVFLKHPAVENCAVIGINNTEDDKAPRHILSLSQQILK